VLNNEALLSLRQPDWRARAKMNCKILEQEQILRAHFVFVFKHHKT
jgi:hypothetical protein